jgi:hypothetical protein
MSKFSSKRSLLILGVIVVAAILAGDKSYQARSYASVQTFTYSGQNSAWVQRLLTRVRGWKCPTDSSSNNGVPPEVKVSCNRDAYVATAVTYAWACECHARSEEDARARKEADQMMENLRNAQMFCSDAPSFGGSSECPTEKIYRCGELR